MKCIFKLRNMLKSMCHGCVILLILVTILHMCQASVGDTRSDNSVDSQQTNVVLKGTFTSETGKKKNFVPLDSGVISPKDLAHQGSQIRKQDTVKPAAEKSEGKRRPVRSPQQGTDPLSGLQGGAWQNQPPQNALKDIVPTRAMGIAASVTFPNHPQHEQPESPAQQRDDELEEIWGMLRQVGYTHSVLPPMSMFPNIMNYTEAGEIGEAGEQQEGGEAGEAEEAEEAGEAGEAEEQEGAGEYEADEHSHMTMSVNMSDPRNQGQESEEYEADEGLQPSETQFQRHKVHNMSQMESDVYDPYYNYGYKFQPKEGKPQENIQPTPVLSDPSKINVIIAGQEPPVADANATAGSQAKITDNSMVTKEKVADFGGLSASSTFGIVLGTIVGFWLIMGPMICLVMKVRDQRKERQKRFLIGPRSSSEKKSDRGIMEAMIMTELGKLPFRKGKKHFLDQNKPDRKQERMSLTDDKDTETFHDAYDTPVLLP